MKNKLLLVVILLLLSVVPNVTPSTAATIPPNSIEHVIFVAGNQRGESVNLALADSALYVYIDRPAGGIVYSTPLACEPEKLIITACGEFVYVGYDCDFGGRYKTIENEGIVLPCSLPSTVYVPVIR